MSIIDHSLNLSASQTQPFPGMAPRSGGHLWHHGRGLLHCGGKHSAGGVVQPSCVYWPIGADGDDESGVGAAYDLPELCFNGASAPTGEGRVWVGGGMRASVG